MDESTEVDIDASAAADGKRKVPLAPPDYVFFPLNKKAETERKRETEREALATYLFELKLNQTLLKLFLTCTGRRGGVCRAGQSPDHHSPVRLRLSVHFSTQTQTHILRRLPTCWTNVQGRGAGGRPLMPHLEIQRQNYYGSLSFALLPDCGEGRV